MKLRDAAQMGGGKDECKLAEWWWSLDRNGDVAV